MAKYENDVKQLLKLIGGKENIQAVSHCMTRMRFVLVDPKKADEKAIEEIPAVKGTFTQAGQYQVIIGNDVSVFYNEFTSYAGIEGVTKEAAKAAAKTNQNVVQKIMGALGEIFAPLIPALICGGLILGFRNIIGEINFFENGTKSLADMYQFWEGTYNFLWLIGEAVFHLLPVGIVWSITKKMGTTQILGIILGLTLVSSQLLNGFSVADTPASEIPVWDFGFAKVEMIGYQGQVIAAMMAGFVLVYLEKFFKKHCPEVISMIVVPFCSLVPACISCYLGVTEPALFGVNLKYGFPLICGMIGSAIAAMISVGCGVQALSIGVGGLPGIISIKPEFYLIFLLAMAEAIVVPFLLTFFVGMKKLSAEDRGLVEKEAREKVLAEAPEAEAVLETEAKEETPSEPVTEIKTILSGNVIPIEEVDDNVFSQKIMGDGVAIEPTDTTVVAPADAEVSIVMAETGHACGLTLANGMEILIHVGIDTVDMGGDGFKLLVAQGDHVKCGTPLIQFDPEKIKAAGHPTTTMLIVTGEGSAKNIQMKPGQTAEAGKTTVISFE